MLRSIYDFKEIITNPGRKRYFPDLWNDAYALCDGDYFMHLENDFYWDVPGAVYWAIEALKNLPNIDYVRTDIVPWYPRQMESFVQVGPKSVGILAPPPNGPGYQFTLNPHVRRDRFPVKEGFPKASTMKHFEYEIVEQWLAEGKRSACFINNHFRHLGVIDAGSHIKVWYAERMTWNRNNPDFDPMTEFKKITDNREYIDLFSKYLNSNNWDKLVEGITAG
jgi:hypothetical protein